MNTRAFLSAVLLVLPISALAQETDIAALLDEAEALEPLETVIVSVDGAVVAERGYNGVDIDDPTNIKSASKSVVSALVGMAIERGMIEGVDQKIGDFLGEDFPDDPDPRLAEISVGQLLSMQAGLAPTSGPNYGRWVASGNWVRSALSQPFETNPGGRMLYSTGSTHLLSAILTEAGGETTLDLAEDWFAPVEDFDLADWERDPQGVYLGGNQMAMSPRSLLAFGEVYRTGGLAPDGTRLLSEEWIDESWTRRTSSRFSGDGYGYGWFLRDIGGQEVRYAWGYGGQMLYIVPELALTVVMTSAEDNPSARSGYRDELHGLAARLIEAAAQEAAGG